MSPSSESDFETNSLEKDESDEFSSKKESSAGYGKGFLISCPIRSNQKMKKMLNKL